MIEFKNVSFTYDSVDRNAGIYNAVSYTHLVNPVVEKLL